MTRFESLFSELTVGQLRLENRIVMLPMGLKFADRGRPTARDVSFYEARAAARPAMIIVGGMGVDDSTQVRTGALLAPYNERFVDDFRAVADAVHGHGVKLLGQLLHLGRESAGDDSRPLLAPSNVASATTLQQPRGLTKSEIARIVDGFRVSSHNLAIAGFDGFEVHAAHGYLGAQFLSSASNHRIDDYGGSFENRFRFVLQTAQAIRDECGSDLALGIRVSAPEHGPGIDAAYDVREVAERISQTDLFDYVSVAVGVAGSYVKDMSYQEGAGVDAARLVKRSTDIPVLASQRITDPSMADDLVSSGAADLVGLGRALLADPDWPRRARDGVVDRIVPCVATLQDCRSGNSPIRCMNNPLTGRELELPPLACVHVTERRRVVVVGGGPAGLEATRVAVARGHHVTLFERHTELGGQVRLAALGPTRSLIEQVVSHRIGQIAESGAELRVGVEATADLVMQQHPDTVIVCTGAVPAAPPFESTGSMMIYDFSSVWASPMDEGGAASSVVVIDDGTTMWEAISAAEHLAAKGCNVTLVTRTSRVGEKLPLESRAGAVGRLRALAVRLVVASAVTEVSDVGVRVTSVDTGPGSLGAEQNLSANAVVVAGNKRADDRLWRHLQDACVQLLIAGDCMTPRGISEALLEGHNAGRDAGVVSAIREEGSPVGYPAS